MRNGNIDSLRLSGFRTNDFPQRNLFVLEFDDVVNAAADVRVKIMMKKDLDLNFMISINSIF